MAEQETRKDPFILRTKPAAKAGDAVVTVASIIVTGTALYAAHSAIKASVAEHRNQSIIRMVEKAGVEMGIELRPSEWTLARVGKEE